MDDVSDKKRKSRAGAKDPVDSTGETWTTAQRVLRKRYESAHPIPAGYRIKVSRNQNARNPACPWGDYDQLVIMVVRTSGASMNTVAESLQRGRFKSVDLWFDAVDQAIKADCEAPDILGMFGTGDGDPMPLLRHDEEWIGFSEAYSIYCAALFQQHKKPHAEEAFKRQMNRAIANGKLRGKGKGHNPEAFLDDLERMLAEGKQKVVVVFRRPAPISRTAKLDLNNRQFRELCMRDVIRCGRTAGNPISTRKGSEDCGLTQSQTRTLLKTLTRVKIFSETGHGTKVYRYLAPEDQERRIKKALSLALSG